jgi:transposase
MAHEEITLLLGGWDGFEIVGVRRSQSEHGTPTVEIELARVAGLARHCSRCDRVVTELHDVTVRRVRELPILDATTWLLVPVARLRCPHCGPTIERLPWLDRFARMTKRFAANVARLAHVLPVQHVADYLGLSWDTVKAIDKAALEARLGPGDALDLTGLRPLRQIAIDEFAIHKGHRYATVVLEPETRRVLWVGHGRRREDLRPFFTLLGPERCGALEAAVMDMSEAYELETRAHCPQVAIVYDLFHVTAKFSRDVIDRVRVDEMSRVAGAAPSVGVRMAVSVRTTRARRRVFRGARWLLLRNQDTLRADERVRLRDLLAANRRLWVVYVLKDALKALWRYRAPAAARRAWDQWYGWAMRSRIAALMTFARRLKPMLPGILAHCRYPLHNGVLEGITNKIKVIKRMAYGFRDDTYFFLKIRAAFPGNP